MELKYYSQHGQDKYLDEYIFNKKEKGFFVDIGAHDGITFNNTYFFEKYRKWNGMCIEPIPEVFEKLDKNRDCIKIKGCIGAENGVSSFLKIQGYPEMLSGLIDNYDKRHLDRIEREIQKYGGDKSLITVKCFNINDLLQKYNISHIDYCSVDVEGSEFTIIESIDFRRYKIDVFSIENNYSSLAIRDFMFSVGYDLITSLNCDDIFRLRNMK